MSYKSSSRFSGTRRQVIDDIERARDSGADELILDRKLTALRAMATQTSGLTAILDPAIYAAQVAQECFIDTRAVAGSYSMQPVMGVRV